jgi:periplasmic copper chaperone A
VHHRTPPPLIGRLLAASGLAAGLLALSAAAASAHVDPDPAQVTGGVRTTIGFTIEHGCEGSPTVDLSFEIPAGVNDVVAQPVPGWSASVESGVARWTGGSLPDDTEGTFSLELTPPVAAGKLVFPLVQRCTSGQLDWIEETVEGQPEPEHPAPVVEVSQGTATTTPPATDTPSTATTAPSTASTSEPSTTTTTVPVEPASDDDDSSPLPYVLGGLAAVVVIGGGGYALSRSRQGDAQDDVQDGVE